MASGTKLQMTFKTNDGEKNFTYNYIDPEVETADVKTLMNTMITNGEIFENVPTEISSAKLITTSETTLRVTE